MVVDRGVSLEEQCEIYGHRDNCKVLMSLPTPRV